MALDRKLETSLGGLEKRLNGIIDEVGAHIKDQLHNFIDMFTRQNQSSLKGSTSNIPESTGRSFATSFSTQYGVVSPVFIHAGTIQGLHNIHGSFNVPTMPGTLASRNSTINKISHSSVHSHSGVTNSGGMSVVGSPRYSNGTNGVGGSILGILLTSAAIGNWDAVPRMGVSLILGNAKSRITSSMGNIVRGGNIGKNFSYSEVDRAAKAKGQSEIAEKEVLVEGYSSKHKEKGVVEFITWNQSGATDIGARIFSHISDLPKSEEQLDLEQNIDLLDKSVTRQVGVGAGNGNACDVYPRRGQDWMVHMQLKAFIKDLNQNGENIKGNWGHS